MDRRGRILLGGGIAVLAAVFWLLRIVPGRARLLGNSDLLRYFYPLYEATYARVAAGRLPLWNPYQLCGLPWIAPLQVGFFYPVHVLYLLLPTRLALAASAALHVTFLAVTTAMFASRVGLSPAAAVLAAELFTLRGSVTKITLFPTALEAAAWLPTGCLAVLAIADGRMARGATLLSVATALSFLAGYPQTTTFLLYAWATLLLALLLASGPGIRGWLRAGATFGVAVALGVLAAGIQLVPAAELARAGTRATRALATTFMYPFGSRFPASADPTLQFLRTEAVAGSQASFGVVGLGLLPAALLARRDRALAGWAVAVGALALAFAVGPLTPLFALYRVLPLLGWFRIPGRIVLLTDFSFAILAAVALSSVLRPDAETSRPPSRAREALIALPLAAGLALGGWQAFHGTGGGALLAVASAAGLVGVIRGRARAAGWIVTAVAAVELFTAPPSGLLRPYDAASAALYRAHDVDLRTLAARAGHDRVWLHPPTLDPTFSPKLATLYGLRSIDDYEPVNLRRQAEYFTYFMTGSTAAMQGFDGEILDVSSGRARDATVRRIRLLDVAATRFLVTTPRGLTETALGGLVARAGWKPVPTGGSLLAFENPRAVPRAFVVYRVHRAPPSIRLLARMARPSFDPLRVSYVDGDVAFAAGPAPPRGEPATFVRDDEGTVELEATLRAPGLVALADSYYPGWRATVDGVPAPIVATNHVFRGVAVPPGRHRVRFDYRPASLVTGAAATAVGLVGIGMLAVVGRRRRSYPASAPASVRTGTSRSRGGEIGRWGTDMMS